MSRKSLLYKREQTEEGKVDRKKRQKKEKQSKNTSIL
jgi:hypothetical protein